MASGGNMKKNQHNKRNEELASAVVKGAVDRVYDLIMANALLILFNIHILIFLLFFTPGSLFAFYFFTAVLLLNALPSYGALYYSLHVGREKTIYHRFFAGYQKMFKKTFLPGAAVSFFSMFVLLNGTFLTVMNLQPLYVVLQLAVIFLLFYVVALVPFMATEQGKMKGYRMALKENFFRGILGSAASTLIIGGSLYLGRLIIFPVILGFSLGALVQEVIHKKTKAMDALRKNGKKKV